ncbi:S41 family peptidase [Paucibacter sp. Y2R2-4]|uniref:S41 family peptidase n=1 Tax=Paucibacter sp. Y2R2-4 TaxID=2893553 RepID=UPI0021E36E5B|nr:S41 family peptidase [Paucibacter sp. Y2R2-4]MCV2350719.1 S41 family peptidase [Paucibacter sp. Y2R2-4]
MHGKANRLKGLLLLLMVMLPIGYFVFSEDPKVEGPEEAVLEAAEILRVHALASASVDWPAAIDRALSLVKESGRRKGLDQALRGLVYEVQDGHSFYMPPDQAKAFQAGPQEPGAPSALFHMASSPAPVPVVQVHGFLSMNPLVSVQAAERLDQALKFARKEFSCGLVVDLSNNGGGNMWPMLWGLNAVLPSTPLGYFVYGNGERQPISSAWPDPGIKAEKQDAKAIAVLVSGRTASSGEFVAASFLAHPNARLFGEPTAGLTTGNQVFPLKSGGLLAVATTRLLTADGTLVKGALVPSVRAGPHEALRLATAWVQKECKGSADPSLLSSGAPRTVH